MSSNKIEVYEDAQNFELSLSWFSPKAIFFAVFTVIWFAFLAFWYSMAMGGGAPWIFLLFPLIHVGAGVYLGYLTLCMFFNKTFIHITNGKLHVLHQPIPWVKGNRSLDVAEIQQLYVQEKISHNKEGGVNRSYKLRLKKKDESDMLLLNLPDLEPEQAQRIEERIEHFLGIPDVPVKGEYGHPTSTLKSPQARSIRRNFADPGLADVFFAKLKDELSFQNNPYQIAAVEQFDWSDGNSDKRLQLLDTDQEERMLYLGQKQALLKAYREEPVSAGTMLRINFQPDAVPAEIPLDLDTFTLKETKKGQFFPSAQAESRPVQQWIYQNSDKNRVLRITDIEGHIRYQLGTRIEAVDFQEKLDLNSRTEQAPDLREDLLSDEELV